MSLLREARGVTFDAFDVTPQVRDLVGRLIIVKPERYEPAHEMGFIDEKTGAKALKPAVWADVLTLDASPFGLVGGLLEYGGDGKVKPNTDRIGTPSIHKGVMIIQTLIVPFLKEEMDDQTYSGFSVGVIYQSDQGKKGNPPFVFGPVLQDQWKRPRARGEEIMAFAEQQVGAWIAGSLVPHSVSELIVPTPQASPDVWKAYEERKAKRAGTAPTLAASTPAYSAPATPSVPATPSQYAPGATTVPVVSTATGSPAVHQQAIPANPTDAVPRGYDPAAWANLDAAVRAMIWSAQPQPTH